MQPLLFMSFIRIRELHKMHFIRIRKAKNMSFIRIKVSYDVNSLHLSPLSSYVILGIRITFVYLQVETI